MTKNTLVRPAQAQPRSLWLAYCGVLLFVLVYFGRPNDWIPGAAAVPFAKIAGIIAGVAFLFSLGHLRRRLPRETIYILLLFAQFWLTVPFAVWRGGAFDHVMNFSKVVLISVVVSLTVTTLPRLRRLIFLQTACMALVAGFTIVRAHTIGGRLEGVIGGDFGNPNDLGLAIAIVVPFVLMFLLETRKTSRKIAWAALAAAMIYALLRTASRSASIALVFSLCVCLWEFAVRGRRRYLLIFAAAAGLSVLALPTGLLTARFGAIFNPADDQGAYGSAAQREELLWRSLEVTAQHPLVGIGPGNFTNVSGLWRTTHNSYTLMSAEAGLPAFILYVMILWRALVNVRRSKLGGQAAECILLAGALRASLAGYLIGSFFSSVAYAFFPYLLVSYTSAFAYITRTNKGVPQMRVAVANRLTRPQGFHGQSVQTEAL